MSCASESAPVNLWGAFRKRPYPSVIVTTAGDSVASCSQYSLPTVTGLTSGEINANFCPNLLTESPFSPVTGVAEAVDPKDVSLAVLAQRERVKNVRGIRRVINWCKLSCKDRPKPNPRCGGDEGDGSLP